MFFAVQGFCNFSLSEVADMSAFVLKPSEKFCAVKDYKLQDNEHD